MHRVLAILLLISGSVSAQIRVSKLVIERNQNYSMAGSDILVADTLIMMDSARIILNNLKKENYIRTKLLIIGKSCVIIGRGSNGKNGPDGGGGKTASGPCHDGQQGRNGSNGLDGTHANDLYLYFDSISLTNNGALRIDLYGGDGGNGGNGGEGGGGSPGTKHCAGGNGGNGGSAGNGGNGGNGGKILFGGEYRSKVKRILGERIVVRLKGGTFGYGGISGYGGPPGLGKKHGISGVRGKDGRHGRPGNVGSLVFEEK
jgi:hypothetical protein